LRQAHTIEKVENPSSRLLNIATFLKAKITAFAANQQGNIVIPLGGKKDRGRKHSKGGQATRETPRPAQAQRGAQNQQRQRVRGAKNKHEDTSTTGQHKQRSTEQTRRRRTAQTQQ